MDLVCFIEKCPSKGLTGLESFVGLRKRIIDDIADKFGREFKWKSTWWSGWTGEAEPYTRRQFLPLFNFSNPFMMNLKLVKSQRSYWSHGDTVEVDLVLGYDLEQVF